jgi:hypothetical protein
MMAAFANEISLLPLAGRGPGSGASFFGLQAF